MSDIDRWANLPNSVLSENPTAQGIRQADGQICCQRCTRVVPDNSSPGLKPSCPHCWVGLDVVEGDNAYYDPSHSSLNPGGGGESVEDLLRGLYRPQGHHEYGHDTPAPSKLPTGLELGHLLDGPSFGDYAAAIEGQAASWRPATFGYMEKQPDGSFQFKTAQLADIPGAVSGTIVRPRPTEETD